MSALKLRLPWPLYGSHPWLSLRLWWYRRKVYRMQARYDAARNQWQDALDAVLAAFDVDARADEEARGA